MVISKIYVGNLPEGCRMSDLQSLFEKFGAVEECDVVKNYGFVHMINDDEAKVAIDNLHNGEFMGNTITVEASHSKVRPKPGMGGKGQCFRCGRQGHWSKECPRGPSRPPTGANGGFRSREPYAPPPGPPPPSYMYGRDRMMGSGGGGRYAGGPDRMRPYPDPYDRRPMPSSMSPRSMPMYDRRSPIGRPPPPPDYMYGRRSPPPMPRHRYEPDPYGPPPRGRYPGRMTPPPSRRAPMY